MMVICLRVKFSTLFALTGVEIKIQFMKMTLKNLKSPLTKPLKNPEKSYKFSQATLMNRYAKKAEK